MNHNLHQLKPNRRPWIILLLIFFMLWVVTFATWIYDDAGYTAGMPGPVFLLHLAAPLLVGLIVVWRKSGLWPGAKAGGIAGALFGAANIGAQLVWGAILLLLGRISPDQPFTFLESIFEVIEFLVLFMIVGLFIGGIGGFVGAAISPRVCRA